MTPDQAAPRLAADRMLGKLARLLRMVGHDVAYVRTGAPDEIVAEARKAERLLLTRDKKLARHGDKVLMLRSNYPFHQAREVIRTLGLSMDHGFTRCVEDNAVLVAVDDPEQHRARLPASAERSPLLRCTACERIYWEGSHVRAMREVMTALADEPLVVGHDHDEDENGLLVLSPLVDLHQAMDVLFLKHRLALMKSRPDESLRWFRRFSLCMHRHIEHERDLVLPTYSASKSADDFERGAAPELFHNEHEKILRHLATIEANTEQIDARVTDDDARSVACLAQLDREKVFGDLLEHHDHRERKFLYPALELVLTEDEKTDLLERMVGRTFEEAP